MKTFEILSNTNYPCSIQHSQVVICFLLSVSSLQKKMFVHKYKHIFDYIAWQLTLLRQFTNLVRCASTIALCLMFNHSNGSAIWYWTKLEFERLQTHLAFLPTCKREIHLTMLVTPAPTRHGVEDNCVDITVTVETGVEMHGNVLRIMTNVDGKAVIKTEREQKKRRG